MASGPLGHDPIWIARPEWQISLRNAQRAPKTLRRPTLPPVGPGSLTARSIYQTSVEQAILEKPSSAQDEAALRSARRSRFKVNVEVDAQAAAGRDHKLVGGVSGDWVPMGEAAAPAPVRQTRWGGGKITGGLKAQRERAMQGIKAEARRE